MTARKRPWWVVTRTPAWDLVQCALWTVIAVLEWIELATEDDDRAWRVTVVIVATLAAIGYLTSATARFRRKRRDAA